MSYDLGPLDELPPGGSAWVEPAALHATPGGGLGLDPLASCLLVPTETHRLRVERHAAGFAVNRHHCPGHVPTPSAVAGLLPVADAPAELPADPFAPDPAPAVGAPAADATPTPTAGD